MDVFWFRVILSFVVGGAWLMLISVAAEKLGTKIGGLLGGLPSTLLIALFFIGLNQGADFAASTTVITPAAFIIDAYFLLILARCATRGYITGIIISGLFWLIAMGALVLARLDVLAVSLALWACGLAALLQLINKTLPAPDIKATPITFTNTQLLTRGLFAGTVIAVAVIISKYCGALIGGIFTAFPAAYISTFTILYMARGLRFSQAFARPLMISGSINTVVYSVAAYFLYPHFGIYVGSLLAYALSLVSAYLVVQRVLHYVTKPIVAVEAG